MSEMKDRELLNRAKILSQNSPDPSTKLGAVVVSMNGDVVGQGWNDFPNGVAQSEDRWNDRDQKYKYVVHAEVNAILNAGDEARGGTLYVYPSFGSPCMCTGCTKVAIQAGIKRVVGLKDEQDPERLLRWKEELEVADTMATEAGIEVVVYE